MSEFKDGDRVATTKRLYVVGYDKEWMEPGSEGLVIGETKTEDYLIVKMDDVELPTYIREANLEYRNPEGLEGFGLSGDHLTVEYWQGSERIKPWVGLTIKTGYTDYDRDYNTETPVTGDYELELDEMVLLRDFLNKAIEKAEDWEWKGRADP